MNITKLIERMEQTTDGEEIHRLIKKLRRCGANQRGEVLEAFLRYMRDGKMEHWRAFIIDDALALIEDGEVEYASAFLAGLEDPVTAYWSVVGVAKTLQAESYARLTEFALDAERELESRAHAVRVLALSSNQTFIAGRPSDPGFWKEEDLPLAELREWRDSGFPNGEGFSSPPTSPALVQPVSNIDKLAAELETKLALYRAKEQDPANPSNWLCPADATDLDLIRSRWVLPEAYVEFLTKFSPVRVVVRGRGCGCGIELFGASDLLIAQHGYSYDPVTEEEIPDWNPAYVVIASKGGDPYVLDISAIQGDDCPVLTAPHGEGRWTFGRVSTTFSVFLRKLARA
jgi:hypothetical protein